jgi:glycosyltransferase involved in cell wall biosynthesis
MKKHFRIATIAACPFPYPRGTPARIFRVAEALAHRGHEVHVVTYHLGQNVEDVPFKVYRTPEIKTYQKCSPGPTYQKLLVLDLLLAVKLLQVLRKHQIDVIHAHHYEGLLVAAAVQKLTNHPIIYDAHTLLQSELPFYGLGLSKKIKKLVGGFLDRQLPQLADYTISVTDGLTEKLIQEAKLIPEKITTITNGVECDHFDLASNDYLLPENDPKILIFTGNLASYQGIELMLQAFRQVLNQRQNVYLRIVSNSRFDDYEALANGLGIREHIDILPSDFHSLPRHFAEADIALNPRVDCDGIPLKLLNYMAAGKAIVSFDGSAKVIEHNKTGLVVEDGNTTAFAQAICRLLDSPMLARQLGANAKNQVKAEHTWQIMAQRTEDVYESVSHLRQPGQLRLADSRQTQILYHFTKNILSHLFLDKSPSATEPRFASKLPQDNLRIRANSR